MTQFALLKWTGAKCKHVAKREENHGDEVVDAMSVSYRIEFTNDRLDDWFPGLRHAIYMAKDSLTIAGVPEITPDRRSDLIEAPFCLKTELAGYMLYMRRGAGHSKPMQVEWPGADAKDFKLDPKPGGICTLDFKVNLSGLDPDIMGRIASMGGRDVEIMFVPPKLQEGTMPDGPAPKGKAKAVSPKQMSLSTPPAPPAAGPAEPAAAGVNPFKFTVVDGKVVDNNPGGGTGPAEIPDATALFLGEHAEQPEVPDAPEEDDPFVPVGGGASDTGLGEDLPSSRTVARKVAISKKPARKL